MKKMEIPDVIKDLERLYRRVDRKVKKFGALSGEEIDEIIQEGRRKRRRVQEQIA